ncbi:tetratricopeptide repeat protein [Ekhidna sp.]|uniref:tetratricopeptide repeat protein n=1 Tax=Ekhidna sp. TaxID=2608089 RepID=UPI003299D65E
MKLNSNDIELIEKSIEGSLNSDEELLFEEKYNSSEAFRESVLFQRSLLSSLDAHHKVKLRNELTQMLREVDSERKVIPLPNKWHMLAASIVILIGVFWIFDLSNSSNKELFNKYYQPFPAQGFVRGDVSKLQTDEILRLYASAEYQETINKIVALNESGKSFNGQMLYLGNSYLALGQSEDAIRIFQTIDEGDRYYPDAQWYLALSYLEKGAKKEAIEVLELLSSQNTVYTTSTLSLLGDLE